MSRIFATFSHTTGRVPPKASWETRGWKTEVEASQDVQGAECKLRISNTGSHSRPRKKQDTGKTKGWRLSNIRMETQPQRCRESSPRGMWSSKRGAAGYHFRKWVGLEPICYDLLPSQVFALSPISPHHPILLSLCDPSTPSQAPESLRLGQKGIPWFICDSL